MVVSCFETRVALTSSASWSACCCMSDSSLRMSASSAMAAGCGGWRRSPMGREDPSRSSGRAGGGEETQENEAGPSLGGMEDD